MTAIMKFAAPFFYMYHEIIKLVSDFLGIHFIKIGKTDKYNFDIINKIRC